MFQDGEYFHVEEEEHETAHAHGVVDDKTRKQLEAEGAFPVSIHRTGSFNNALNATSSV